MTTTEARISSITLNGLSDVDTSNKDAHARLGKLLDSLTGKSLFSGGSVVIKDNSTIFVAADLRDAADQTSANEALRKAFFQS